MDEQESKVSHDLLPDNGQIPSVLEGNMLESIFSFGAEGLFYVITLVFIGFSLAFAYHWWSYSIYKAYTLIMLAVYLGVSAIFFIGMMISLTAL